MLAAVVQKVILFISQQDFIWKQEFCKGTYFHDTRFFELWQMNGVMSES